MTDDPIAYITEKVETACRSPNNIHGYGIWSHHIHPMIEIARSLAKSSNADEEILVIATLLHDYAGIIDKDYIKDHHIHGAREAEKLLSELHYPDDRIEIIKECILSHRGSVRSNRIRKEAILLADADAIAHFLQLPSLFYAAYKERAMAIDEGKEWIRQKMIRDWQKLSDQGKKYVEPQYRAVMLLLENAEGDNSPLPE